MVSVASLSPARTLLKTQTDPFLYTPGAGYKTYIMTDPNVLKFTLATEDFDLSLLPSSARQRGTALFRDAVKAYLTAEF